MKAEGTPDGGGAVLRSFCTGPVRNFRPALPVASCHFLRPRRRFLSSGRPVLSLHFASLSGFIPSVSSSFPRRHSKLEAQNSHVLACKGVMYFGGPNPPSRSVACFEHIYICQFRGTFEFPSGTPSPIGVERSSLDFRLPLHSTGGGKQKLTDRLIPFSRITPDSSETPKIFWKIGVNHDFGGKYRTVRVRLGSGPFPVLPVKYRAQSLSMERE